MQLTPRSYTFFTLNPNPLTVEWQERIAHHLTNSEKSFTMNDSGTAELVIVLGGDGTLLHAMRSTSHMGRRFVGLNTGHAGFLATARVADHFVQTVEDAIHGRLVPMSVPVVQLIHRSGSETRECHAINDVLLELSMTWLRIRAESIDTSGRVQLIKEFHGSGLCLCTPIGSTSPMAVHFQTPRMDPSLLAFYLKGVNDRQPPMAGLLVPGLDRVIRLTLLDIETNHGIPEVHRNAPAWFADGIHSGVLRAGDTLEVRYQTDVAQLLRRPDDGHWDRVLNGLIPFAQRTGWVFC